MANNRLANTNEYLSFRSAIPLKRVIVDDNDSKVWKMYDAGPKSIKSPILCLPPASGNADLFYRQVLSLPALGYRVIALDYPVYWNVEEFCIGLRKIIDYLHLDQIHIFGCSLGAYLGLKFAERMRNAGFVASMILCNGFTDTSIFRYTRASSAFWMIPGFLLKRLLLGSLACDTMDSQQADATDFVVDCLDSLSQQEIASRLTLHCNGEYLRQPHVLQHIPVTIIDVFDSCAISQNVKDDMYKCFPYAKKAHLKTGGNFPYISRAAEVNLHLRIHLKPFEGLKASAKEGSPLTHCQEHQTAINKDTPSILSSSITSSCGSEHSDGETSKTYKIQSDSTTPKTLLSQSQSRSTEQSPPTIEVDDDDAIDFPI